MLKISRRSRLSDAAGVRFICHLHRNEAETRVAQGAIVPDETRGEEIVSFRLTTFKAITPIRPGSFGVNRTRFPVNQQYGLSGGIVFSHRDTYGELAA